MKQLAFLVATLLATFPLHANSEKAIAAFLANSSVRQAMEQIPSDHQVDIENIATMTIKTSCGYAGCFETALVSARVVPLGDPINPQSWSIVAKVVVHEGNIAPRVELLARDFFEHRSEIPIGGGCYR